MQLASVHETHFSSIEVIASQQFWVRRQGWDMRATVTVGFGSVAVLWALSQWTELSTTIISARLMIVELRHTTGQTVRLVGGHMHDDPGLRKDQWRDLGRKLRSLSSMATFLMMDHNSLMVPAKDLLKGHQGGRQVREARYQEMEVLADFDMHDVWGLAHSGSEHPPLAKTYAWHTRDIVPTHGACIEYTRMLP